MPVDIELVRRTYARMSNRELLDILTENGAGLTNEALLIVEEEVSKRNLSTDYLKSLEVQHSLHAEQEAHYVTYVRDLPCPHCLATGTKLLVNEIKASGHDVLLGCPTCLNSINRQAMIALSKRFISLFGIFRAIFGTIHNTRNIGHNNRQQLDEEMLTTFVREKAGVLSAYESHTDQRPQYLKKLKGIESY